MTCSDLIDQLERGEIAYIFGPEPADIVRDAITDTLTDIAKWVEGLP
jgi:hypothetical protein